MTLCLPIMIGFSTAAVASPDVMTGAVKPDAVSEPVALAKRVRKGGKRDNTIRRADRTESGYLDSHGGGTTGQTALGASNRDDRQRQRREATEQRFAAYQLAQRDVATARAEAMRLYQIYDQLNVMTPDQAHAAYPQGTYMHELRTAAINYNTAAAAYQAADAEAMRILTRVSDGQELNGSVLSELNALLGQ